MKAQRGAAALPITLMLAFAVLLAVAFANRSVVLQVRSSVHQVHTAQAHEAAQAGLAWTLAQLNLVTPIGEDCRASHAASAIAWHDQARLGALQASCVAEGTGWACHCPRTGEARSIRSAASPAFHVQLAPDPVRPDRWHASVTGQGADAGRAIQLQLDIGRLPGLDTVPAAALTVRSHAAFTGDIAITHTNAASGGVTLHTGGAMQGVAPRVTSTPGTPPRASIVSDDVALASLTPQGLHASVFRMGTTAWREQPGVATVDCHSACDTALATAARHHSLIALDGGLRLDTLITLGSPQRPVLLVVDGPVELHAAATLHGLLYLREAHWTDNAGASVHGAVIAENDLQAEGASHIHHDVAVLQALQRRGGTHAPVAGSWRDL